MKTPSGTAVLALLLIGCSGAAQLATVCGESFCLPEGAKIISRDSHAEDFNLYRVQEAGNRFVIYEGNHPKRSDGSVVLTLKKEWPNYLEVSGPCATEEDCPVRAFAAKIALR